MGHLGDSALTKVVRSHGLFKATVDDLAGDQQNSAAAQGPRSFYNDALGPSAEADGSSFCGEAPHLRAGNLGQVLAIVSPGPAAMPVFSVVLRASALRPLVRLGRGAFSALSPGDGQPHALAAG